MKIVLASNNQGKIKELQSLLPEFDVVTSKSILGDYEVEEDGDSFKANAIKKAVEIYKKIGDENIIVISDDSGITVPALNNEPNIYSARYAGIGASDKQNNQKLISKLNENNLCKTDAYYTACIAMVYKGVVYTTHGWMHGYVINETKGDGGFGYDPMFIPEGYDETLGTLDPKIKKDLSHRTKALKLMLRIIKVVV